MTDILAPPRQTAAPAPPRRPGSVRRTSTIDVSWPDGQRGDWRLVGRARDCVTPRSGGAPIVRAEDNFEAVLKPDRSIAAITAAPHRAGLEALVGRRGGNGLRGAIAAAVPDERRDGTCLYLILDDIAGVSLISSWAWSHWRADWLDAPRERLGPEGWARLMRSMEDICAGHAKGSPSRHPDRVGKGAGHAATPDLRHPDDPEGWHAFALQHEVGMRRARRIDVRREEAILIDAAFQDSASTPLGERAALHEYSLSAVIDPMSLRIVSIEAEPRVLPYGACRAAGGNVSRLIGADVRGLRERVLAELPGVLGCTHLNDALRALAEVPVLADLLEAY